jgi:hypothetical protein
LWVSTKLIFSPAGYFLILRHGLSISTARIRYSGSSKKPKEGTMQLRQLVDPYVSTQERTQVVKWLGESRKEFFEAIGGVSDAQWKWKPAPERWSLGETAEHIVLAEALLFGFVRKAMAAPPNPAWEEQTKGKTELLIQVMPSRQGKGVAPEPIVPHESLTRAQVLERFEQHRIDIVNFARESQMAWKEHTVVHPFPAFGALNAYQWLIYVPLHTMRHNQQIADVKATLGYPSSG